MIAVDDGVSGRDLKWKTMREINPYIINIINPYIINIINPYIINIIML